MSLDVTDNHQTFAVLGAGPGGRATAAYLARSGYRVNLYAYNESTIKDLTRDGVIRTEGMITGRVAVSLLTTDLRLAVEDANVLIVAVPGHAHQEIARSCAKYLKDGQIIVLTPGRLFGAIEFRKACQAHGLDANVMISEAQTIPFTCRCNDVGVVQLLAIKRSVKLAAFPAKETDDVISEIRGDLPMFQKASNILETGLNNVGCILHPLPTLLNLGWIETERTEFKHYYEGITPSVARILEQLDDERMAVGTSLDIPMCSVQEWLQNTYDAGGETLFETIRNTSCYETIDAPNSIDHRFLYEDVPTGLVPLSSLADALGIRTPVTNLVIELACLACAVDFWDRGRTLQRLGIAQIDRHKLLSVLTN